MFKKIKRYYDSELWSKQRVRNAYMCGVITEEEYIEIVSDNTWE